MATKRKAQPRAHPYRSLKQDNTKRLSFGRGSSEKYHQHAQSLARNGKYEEAIDVLKEALLQKDAVDANYVKIMDSRSAIYCKMGRYKEAVSDAKCMIAAEEQNEKGYLRAGKALLLDGRPEDALEVYKYGLKCLPKDHPQCESLLKIHDKLVERMLSRLRDPIQHLNDDCLLEIFKYLPFRQIVAMTRISKTWRAYLKSQPSLWYDVSFKGSRPWVSPENIKACILNSQKAVKRLQLHDVKNPYDALRQASMCPRLEHLDLDIEVDQKAISQSSCLKPTLKTLKISSKTKIYPDLFCETLRGLPNLERLEVHYYVFRAPTKAYVEHLPNLKALVLDMRLVEVYPHFKPIWVPEDVPNPATISDLPTRKTYFERVPNLEELCLASTRDMRVSIRMLVCLNDICHPSLRTLEIRNLHIYGTRALPETLEHLHLVDCHAHPSSSFVYRGLAPTLPNLKTLSIAQCGFIDIEQVLRILQFNDGALESLRLDSCDKIRSTDLPLLARYDGTTTTTTTKALKNLKSLYLHGMGLYHLSDQLLLSLIRNMPRLQELHVPHTAVTGSLIKRIVLLADDDGRDGVFPRIKLLNLKGCEDVSSEAVEWGRARGLKIINR